MLCKPLFLLDNYGKQAYNDEIKNMQAFPHPLIVKLIDELPKSLICGGKNNKKFWPVFLSLCDLPLILRDSKSNKIIAGLFTNNMYKSVGNHI